MDDTATAIGPTPPGPPVSKVRGDDQLSALLAELELPPSSPALVLVGGASGLDETELARLRPFFTDALVPLASVLNACIIDGGTDIGVMRLIGRARAELCATFPLIGVAAEGIVAPAGTVRLEPNHSHVILVPGTRWGDESRWMDALASQVASGAPSVTVLINGGEIALDDVAQSVAAGRPVLIVSGSGRTADMIAAALRDGSGERRVRELVASGLVEAVALADGPAALARATVRLLSPREMVSVGEPPAAPPLAHRSPEADLGTMIDELPLLKLQRRYLRSRWLYQLLWMESRARPAQRRYHILRLTTIIGGVMVPALVTLDLTGTFGTVATFGTWFISLLVAISAAVEGFFRYGDRWRHYRRTIELLNIEGWEFFQLTGEYAGLGTHVEAHPRFVQRVEQALRQDAEGFVSTVTRESPDSGTAGMHGG